MADITLQPGSAPANPVQPMFDAAMRPINRRALIGGVGLAAVAGALPATLNAIILPKRDPHWEKLVTTCERADAEVESIGKELDVVSSAYQAQRKALGEPPAKPAIQYPRPIAEMTIGELKDGDFSAPKAELGRYDADLAAWTANEQKIGRVSLDEVNRRWEFAVDAENDAAHAVFAYPSPNAEALSYKLQLAEREYRGCDLDQKVTAQIFADVRRFVGRVGE